MELFIKMHPCCPSSESLAFCYPTIISKFLFSRDSVGVSSSASDQSSLLFVFLLWIPTVYLKEEEESGGEERRLIKNTKEEGWSAEGETEK